ncbi:MAG: inositol monophosphatase family protein [Nocardioides sp.]|uniref:inositol monophosphatase family protein n=1 Tax=Nocardioides sp. TaxID=35761 RepID=UPI003F0B8966
MSPDVGTEGIPDPRVLRDLAVSLATEAAALARRMRADGIEVADTKSSAVDVVTAADRACEELIRERLLRERPDDAVLGEEGEDRPGTSGVRWVVDPIDGTVNYLYGLPECAVSVAAEVGERVVAGAVVNIVTSTTYAAAAGHGATRDGQSIGVRSPTPESQWLVLTGFGYQAEVRAHQAACVARMLPAVRDIRRMGSCALDLCHVAEGTADAYVEEGPRPWDHSAGGLVLSEAGGRFELVPGSLPETVPGADPRGLLVGTSEASWDAFGALLVRSGFTSRSPGEFRE